MRSSTVMANERYGRLMTVHSYLRKRKSGFNGRVWLCQCDCGKTCDIPQSGLKAGQTRSCGCLQKETAINRSLKHGHARVKTPTSEYRIWVSMRQRCNNPRDRQFVDYGGRGIRVCERWSLFVNFLSDMGPRPENHSIDRINNSGNYEPSNCRWATQAEQMKNTRASKFITYMGETLCHTEWARRLGLSNSVIGARIKRGLPLDRVLVR